MGLLEKLGIVLAHTQYSINDGGPYVNYGKRVSCSLIEQTNVKALKNKPILKL